MKIKDHFLSKEEFKIIETEIKGILKTENIPFNLDKYYQSDKYLSHTKDNSIKSKLYKFIQNLNEKYKLKIILKYKTSGNILDYGCGDGSFLKFMKKNNFSVSGIEPNKKASDIAKEKIGGENIFNSLNEIENDSLDIITLWHVLEHIDDPENIIKNIKEKLKDNGVLIIAIPNHNSFDSKFYKKYWAAWDVPRHIYHYNKEGAITFFNNNGLDVSHTFPLPFDSFYISLISESYKKTNFLGLLRFSIIAILSNIKGMLNGNYSSIIYILNK